jgi:hypothetical protein
MELGEEPPAVVDLLTNDWRVTADAIPATLLDLAARGYLDLEQYGPGCTVCRVRRTSGEGLEAYERMVLEHVAGLTVDGVVPAEALTTVHRRLPVPGGVGRWIGVRVHGGRGPGQAAGPREPAVR